MTRSEAEKIINNYKDFDEDSGEEYSYTIISYEGTDTTGNHLFKCKAEGEDEEATVFPIYAVTGDKELIAIPT